MNVALLLAAATLAASCSAARVHFESCDKKGFVCQPSKKYAGKTDITFSCNSFTTWDIEIYLWQFRAPVTVSSLTVQNCTRVRLSLMCTGDNRGIQWFLARNISHLQFAEMTHSLSQSAPEMIFEHIGAIDTIPSRTFTQIRQFPYKYGCFVPARDLEQITFKNVTIKTLQREAFHRLTNISKFNFIDVTIEKILAAAVQVFLAPKATFTIEKSTIHSMEHLGIWIRGDRANFIYNLFGEISTAGINATTFNFSFNGNDVQSMNCKALSILSRNIELLDNTLKYLGSCALQGLGPGLPENSLQSFGHLKFMYTFQNNLIESLEVGSLHPDWQAYKNVGGNLVVSHNTVKCSCAELAWLGTKEGYGKEYSALDQFHEIILEKENKNLCLDAPCQLPIDVVRLMVFKGSRCMHNMTLEKLCELYHPTTTTTSTTTTKRTPLTPAVTRKSNLKPLILYKKLVSNSPKIVCDPILNSVAVIIVFKTLFFT